MNTASNMPSSDNSYKFDTFPCNDANGITESWTGMRAMSSGDLPYISTVSPRIFASLGREHLGWTNSSGSAHLLRQIMLEEATAIEPAPLSPIRR